jgi:hypothetical protein
MLLVTSYGCGVGEKYGAVLMSMWISLIGEYTDNGNCLPIGITKESYEKALALPPAASNYILPMHLLLLKMKSSEDIASVFFSKSTQGFTKKGAGISKVEVWKEKAIEMAASKNAKYLKAWRTPTTSDMLEACERLMPEWVNGCGVLVKRKKILGDEAERDGDSVADKERLKKLNCALRRWGDEKVSFGKVQHIESNATGKICRICYMHS